jgi:hypothetical protein
MKKSQLDGRSPVNRTHYFVFVLLRFPTDKSRVTLARPVRELDSAEGNKRHAENKPAQG